MLTIKLVGKEPTEGKTKEAPASLRPGFEEAQQVIKMRRNQIKTQGMSQLAENLLNTAEERKRRRKEDFKDTSTRGASPKGAGHRAAGLQPEPGPEACGRRGNLNMIIILTHSNSSTVLQKKRVDGAR